MLPKDQNTSQLTQHYQADEMVIAHDLGSIFIQDVVYLILLRHSLLTQVSIRALFGVAFVQMF